MTNAVYDTARRQLLLAGLNWPAVDLMLVPWDGTPDFNPADTKITSINARGHAERGYSLPVTQSTVSANGTAQTNVIVIPDVAIGPDITWFTMCIRKPILSESTLILFIDTALNLPFASNALDIAVTPDWLQNKGWWRP